MPTPEYRVESVSVVRENQLRITTEVAGDAALFVEHGDALNPSSWSLLGPEAPLLTRVFVAQDGTGRTYLADVDAALIPGAELSVALQPWARSRYGQATKADAVTFVVPPVRAAAGITAAAPGADIAFPPIADSRGDLVRIDRLDALRARVLLFVSSRRASFGFASMETFGRGIEAKRTYGPAKLLAEASTMKSALSSDPDVKRASVAIRELGDAVVVDVEIVPAFGEPPLSVTATLKAGETP